MALLTINTVESTWANRQTEMANTQGTQSPCIKVGALRYCVVFAPDFSDGDPAASFAVLKVSADRGVTWADIGPAPDINCASTGSKYATLFYHPVEQQIYVVVADLHGPFSNSDQWGHGPSDRFQVQPYNPGSNAWGTGLDWPVFLWGVELFPNFFIGCRADGTILLVVQGNSDYPPGTSTIPPPSITDHNPQVVVAKLVGSTNGAGGTWTVLATYGDGGETAAALSAECIHNAWFDTNNNLHLFFVLQQTDLHGQGNGDVFLQHLAVSAADDSVHGPHAIESIETIDTLDAGGPGWYPTPNGGFGDISTDGLSLGYCYGWQILNGDPGYSGTGDSWYVSNYGLHAVFGDLSSDPLNPTFTIEVITDGSQVTFVAPDIPDTLCHKAMVFLNGIWQAFWLSCNNALAEGDDDNTTYLLQLFTSQRVSGVWSAPALLYQPPGWDGVSPITTPVVATKHPINDFQIVPLKPGVGILLDIYSNRSVQPSAIPAVVYGELGLTFGCRYFCS